MKRLRCTALLALLAPSVHAQFDPLGLHAWNETSRTGHAVMAGFNGHAGGVLGATTVVAVCLLREVATLPASSGTSSCVTAPLVMAGTAAGVAAGLHLTPASRYRGSVVGGTLAGTAALAGTYYLYLEPRFRASEEESGLGTYLDAAVLMGVGTAGTALGDRYGPGGRWHAVEVAPAADASGGTGMRLTVRF